MKFTEALENIKFTKKCMYRKDCDYALVFSLNFLMCQERSGDIISPYTIHEHDFEYDWEVTE